MVALMGTGHRPDKYLVDEAEYGLSIGSFIKHIDSAIQNSKLTVTSVLSGMAMGFDTALAEYATDNDIPLIAYLPYIGQEYKWPIERQRQYRALLSNATQIKVAIDYIPSSYKEATEALHMRNAALVRDCDEAIVLYNPHIRPSGTYYTVGHLVAKFANSTMSYINIWDDVIKSKDFQIKT